MALAQIKLIKLHLYLFSHSKFENMDQTSINLKDSIYSLIAMLEIVHKL